MQNVRRVEVTVAKVDKKLGLVVGYAIVCKVKNADGAFEDYYDTGSIDPATGEVYSDHITEEAMLEGVTEFMKSSARGADTVIYLASSPAVEGVSGRYFVNRREARSSEESYNPGVAARLWKVSEELTAASHLA